MARATSSLPVPVSPRISTGASLCATRDICANSSRIGVLRADEAAEALLRPQLDRRRLGRVAQHHARCRRRGCARRRAAARRRPAGSRRRCRCGCRDRAPRCPRSVGSSSACRRDTSRSAMRTCGAGRRAERRPPGDRRTCAPPPRRSRRARASCASTRRGLIATKLGLVVVLPGDHQGAVYRKRRHRPIRRGVPPRQTPCLSPIERPRAPFTRRVWTSGPPDHRKWTVGPLGARLSGVAYGVTRTGRQVGQQPERRTS